MKNNNLIYIIIIIVVLAGAGYGAWRFLGHSNQTTNSNGNGQQSQTTQSDFQGQGNLKRGNFKPLHGTISSISGNSIIMKADDNSDKTINVSDSTRISKNDNGQRSTLTFSDLKANDEINVMAGDTTSSTISARMIFIGQFTMPSRNTSTQNNSFNQNNGDSPSGQNLN